MFLAINEQLTVRNVTRSTKTGPSTAVKLSTHQNAGYGKKILLKPILVDLHWF